MPRWMATGPQVIIEDCSQNKYGKPGVQTLTAKLHLNLVYKTAAHLKET